MIELSSITRNMAVVRKNRRATSRLPVIHWAPFLAMAAPSSSPLLRCGCASWSMDGLSTDCFGSLGAWFVLRLMNSGMVEFSLEYMVEVIDLLVVSIVAAQDCLSQARLKPWRWLKRERCAFPKSGWHELTGPKFNGFLLQAAGVNSQAGSLLPGPGNQKGMARTLNAVRNHRRTS